MLNAIFVSHKNAIISFGNYPNKANLNKIHNHNRNSHENHGYILISMYLI